MFVRRFTVRLFFVLLLTFSVFFFSKSPVLAQTQPIQNPYIAPNNNPDVPKNLHTWTQNVMMEVISAMTCQLSGVDPTNPSQECLGVDQKTGKIGFVKNGGGALAVMTNMMAVLYTPPIHTQDYFNYLSKNFGIAKPTYAADDNCNTNTGFCSLKLLIPVWTVFRNLIYLLFVIVFVIVGLAVMLRVKIDPRTVMTIQNQIPKIIIGLVLITFSFAIAGFLIDLMYVSIYVVYQLALNIVQTPDINLSASTIKGMNPVGLQMQNPTNVFSLGLFGVADVAGKIAGPLTDTARSLLGIAPYNVDILSGTWIPVLGDIGQLVNLIASQEYRTAPLNWVADILSVAVGVKIGLVAADLTAKGEGIFQYVPVLGGAGQYAAGVLVGSMAFKITEAILRNFLPFLIIYLIILISLIYTLIRVWFRLLIAYISILIDIIFAPFWIVGGLLPGASIGIVPWLKDLIANLAAFPTVIGMFLLAKIFAEIFSNAGSNQITFVPPLIGIPTNKPGEMLGAIVSLGFILMTPNVINIVKQAIKAPKVEFGSIAQPLGVGASVVAAPVTKTWQALTRRRDESRGIMEEGILRRAVLGSPAARRIPKVLSRMFGLPDRDNPGTPSAPGTT